MRSHGVIFTNLKKIEMTFDFMLFQTEIAENSSKGFLHQQNLPNKWLIKLQAKGLLLYILYYFIHVIFSM